jgi:hypothetical protein
MILLIPLLLVAQGIPATNSSRWSLPDVLIEDSLGPYVEFAADYNYTTGDIYVACVPDSGIYFHPDSLGILFFRSTDHGETWDMIGRDVYEAEGWTAKEIDLVATRSDTAYVLFSWYYTDYEYDGLQVGKIYDSGGDWSIEWISPIIDATEIRSPKLVRDDFADFYLYLSYLDITPDRDSLIILRSTDRGYNWSNLLRASSVAEWQDQDIAIADSSIYHLSTFQYFENQTLQFSYWKNRGTPTDVINLQQINTNEAGQIKYPRLGATTTLPDTGQLVYAFYSQEDSITGNYDLLYLYSEGRGNTWDSIPDTLANESSSPIICDLRGYQVAPNQWMDIAYCFTSSAPSFENFWCWASESEPTNWQGTASVGTGSNRSIPEIVYSPGASGAAVVYNDSLGNLWFDAPWRESGITEKPNEILPKTKSKIALAGSTIKLGSTGATVYDITGREIIKLNNDSWNLKNGNGQKVETGIYFIIDKTGNKLKLSVIK